MSSMYFSETPHEEHSNSTLSRKILSFFQQFWLAVSASLQHHHNPGT
eukprot:gene17102-19496_t